jgi:NADH:ubiquinone oxidoreductase subunit F (NADH-binding)
LRAGTAREIAAATGVPEAHVYGVGSFYDLLARPDAAVRVCSGLSCRLAGSDAVLEAARAAGLPVESSSCLAACDRPPAVLHDRRVLPAVTPADVERAGGDWRALADDARPPWRGSVGPEAERDDALAFDLLAEPGDPSGACEAAAKIGPEAVIGELEAAGLQGRGGAGFPAHVKWRAVREQPEAKRYLVLNADESEPGTFKDRELLLRRPDRVLAGLAIAARCIGADEIYLYLRGEFGDPWRVLERSIAELGSLPAFEGLQFHLHSGHGAYICGEETALLEALEGKRGMPRLRPPFPVERGLWDKPTLIHNVETIAAVPAIVERGGSWFRDLGRTGPGTKLYSVSGHVEVPGTYELPLGVSLDELAHAAGGYVGELKAFSPGGASSGFLPARERTRPLDYTALAEVGSMLGSAGVVVLNSEVDMRWAAAQQLRFFEDESCGQCAPCRIGTRYLREALDHHVAGTASAGAPSLAHAADVAWQMNEGSICGLGQTAPLPLSSALQHFPEEFGA